MFYLNDEELAPSEFLYRLAEQLLETPGGWGGVAEDLKEIADKHIPTVVTAGTLFDLEYDGVKAQTNLQEVMALVPSLLQQGWIQRLPILLLGNKIADGWRQVQALKLLGWKDVVVVVKQTDPQGLLEANRGLMGRDPDGYPIL